MNKKKIPLINLLKLKFPEIPHKELFAGILCGEVYINNEKICDKNRLVPVSSDIIFKYKKYVSRGGVKLAHVLEKWNIEVENKVYIDAGASTGGFTDCLLKHGAGLVYSVDVGYNQLAYSLRIDPRVCVYEQTNIFTIQKGSLDPQPHAAVCDLSFRSVVGAATHILDLTISDTLIALIKPQFEWENPDPGFNGIIKKTETLIEICTHLVRKLYSQDVYVSRVELSPIAGTKGNRELFFLLKKKSGEKKEDIISSITELFLDK
ncbi:MAG: TlyA family rRNA (cytidine-2'-O)-methyltransferase [Spirochaetales bacterium]|nr:TlyA family rRNA (cytidine-2'-O)-methyltransferase [Spirochaetales bacterium]